MNKTIIMQLVLITGLGFLVLQFLPFWSVVPVGMLAGWIFDSGGDGRNFLTGFLGVFLLWSGTAWMLDNQNDHILSGRMADLFSLPPAGLVLVTGIIGGWLGGAGVWCGGLLRKNLMG